MVSTTGRGLSGSLPKLHAIDADNEDGVVILATRRNAKNGTHVLIVDEALIEHINAARQAGEETPELPVRPPVESQLTPREIQTRLRSGRTLEQVAAEAGVDPAWVDRFAAPVRAEQLAAVQRAGRSTLHTPRKGPSERDLESSVLRNLADRGVVLADEDWQQAWSARHLVDNDWIVSLTFRNRGRTMVAEWVLDLSTGSLASRNRLGTDLGYFEGGRRSAMAGSDPAAAVVTVTRRRAAKRPAKKAAGRPKKTAAKKAVGRPRKATAVGASKKAAAAKKAVGRPRKATAVGAPKKVAAVKKAVGRPRKATAVDAPKKVAAKKAVGWPRKATPVGQPAPAVVAKKAVGRPRKTAAVAGRPAATAVAKKAVGRPKQAAVVTKAAARPKPTAVEKAVDGRPRTVAPKVAAATKATINKSAALVPEPVVAAPVRPAPAARPQTPPAPAAPGGRPASAEGPVGAAPVADRPRRAEPAPVESAVQSPDEAGRAPDPYAPLQRLLLDQVPPARQHGEVTIPISSRNGIQARRPDRPLRAARFGPARRPAADPED